MRFWASVLAPWNPTYAHMHTEVEFNRSVGGLVWVSVPLPIAAAFAIQPAQSMPCFVWT